MNPEVELIIKARNEAKRALKELQNQLKGLDRQFKRNEDSAKRFSKQTRNLAPILIEVNRASSIVSRGLLNIGRNLVGAAANFETYINTVRVFSESQEQANARVARLLEVSKELVGLDTGNIISFFGRLTQLNLTDEQAIQAITAVTEGIAEQGKSAATARQVLEQFAQALGNTSILAQDWRTIFRELPQVAKAIADEFGISARSAGEFREGLKSLGLTWQDVRPRFISALDAKTIGANLNTIRSQVDILEDQAEVTAAAFGEIITPHLITFLKHLNRLLEILQDLDPQIKKVIVTLGVIGAGGATLVAGFTAVSLAIGAMNAALAISVGATGLAGLSAAFAGLVPFIGPAGLIVAGLTAAGVAIYKLDQLSRPRPRGMLSVVQVDNTAKAYEMLKKQVDETGESLVKLTETAQRETFAQARVFSQHFGGLSDEEFSKIFGETPVTAVSPGEFDEISRSIEQGAEGVIIATDKTTKVMRNLTLELVKADTAMRRIRRTIRSGGAQTIAEIKSQTEAEVAAIKRLADLEVEQAEKSIENKQELAARIQEIRDKQEDDIADAVKRGGERVLAYEQAVFDARAQAGAAFAKIREDQENQIAAAGARALAIDAHRRALIVQNEEQARQDQIAEGLRRLSLDANVRAKQQQAAEDAARAQSDFETNELGRRINTAVFAIEQYRKLDMQRYDVERQLSEMETARNKIELAKRLDQFREYYNIVRRLNFNSVESFIQSAIRGTTEYLQQLAIRKTAEIAFSQIGAAAGLAGGVLTGGAGFAIAGGVAITAGILSSIIGNAQRDNSRIFHSASNDAQIEMAVSRRLSRRSSHDVQMNNRQQAIDIAAAVERGIARETSPTIDVQQPIQVNLILNDRVVQQVTIRQDELRQTRRI